MRTASALVAGRVISGLARSPGSITDAKLCERAMRGVTHVFHLAGASSSKSDQEEMERDNIDATQRLLEAARQAPRLRRVVLASSSSVYGAAERFPTRRP